MTLVWDKGGAAPHERVMRFLSGEDVVLDRELFLHDIRATAAHVRGLAARDLLSQEESTAMRRELDALAEDFRAGCFVLDERFEDGHSAIEARLTERLGEAGGRVHLGRSRNDQVLVALRLYMRDALRECNALLLEAGRAALVRARGDERTPMPGYTHLQRAVPSSAGLWMASFAEGFAEDAHLAKLTLDWLDACPLGTAAGYGVNLPLARDDVAGDLGFSRLQVNPMAAQASRGKMEVQVAAVFWQALQTVRRLAWDLTLFSTAEYGFVRLPEDMLTGSSIMPNKRNPDVSELLRTSAATVGGCMAELQQMLSLPSGYHRDLQATKGPMVRATRATLGALGIVPSLLERFEIDRERMRAAIDAEMYATDRAVELAAEGVPFRQAYRQVASNLGELQAREPEQSVAARTSPGACADLRLDEIASRLEGARAAGG